MKLNIAGYDIDIKAKNEWESRNSKESTMQFLNNLSLWASKAAEQYNNEGLNGLAKEAQEASQAIYDFLKENGLYTK